MTIQPTPWKLVRGKIIDADGKIVCGLPRRKTNDTAELIIAAPEMLARLVSLEDTLTKVQATLQKAKAALKETGSTEGRTE